MRAFHVASIVLPVVLAGCASMTPSTPQLNAANRSYAHAAKSPATSYASDQLTTAHQSLDRAHQANAWDDPHQTSFAELARSRAQLAEYRGYTVVALQQRAAANDRLAQAQQQRQAQVAQMQEAARQQGRALMQGMLPLMSIADGRHVVDGQTQFVFTRNLNFAVNEAILPVDGKAQLDKIAEGIQSVPGGVTVIVQGYTDSTGNDQINQPLSEKRASAVADYLVSRGVPRDHIETTGYGADRPIASNDALHGRAQNRRAVVLINLVGTGVTNMQPACGTAAPSGAQQQPSGTEQQQPR